MKHLFIILVFFCCALSAAPIKELKVFSIGNSFSNNAHRYLPQIVQAHGKAKLTLGNAYIGGCSFERHWNEHLQSEKDPSHKPYSYQNKRMSLRDLLTAEKWDIVTIQQASPRSFKPETFYPFADYIVALIRELAPQAQIVVHRTWAYRPDHKLFTHSKNGFTPQKMFDLSADAYGKLAAKYNLKMIPAGDAMWNAYNEQSPKPIPVDPDFDYKNPVYPNLPKDTGALINGYLWRKDSKTGQYKFHFDGIHANNRGQYLLACTWYAFLFQMPLDDLQFVPKELDPQDAKFLRDIAQKTAFAKKP